MTVTTSETPAHRVAVLSQRYEIEQVIGRGGMADVYRGRDLVLQRPVAIKILREVTADPVARQRFNAEARTLAGLSHPGLVTVLDAGIESERPYLVMELVEGSTLADACRRGDLDPRSATDIGARVAEALAYVHSKGIVHRDVKPANVLLRADGRVLLADFGIAKLTADAAALTATGATVGTAAYLAPEQLKGGPVGAAADVYALGLVLIEALSGRQVYSGTPVEAAVARLSGPPAVPDTLPAGLSGILRRMVSTRPEDRPPLAEIVSVLQQAGTAGAAGPAGTPGADPSEVTVRLPAGPAPGPVAGRPATSVLPRPDAGHTAVVPPARPRWRRVMSERPLAAVAGVLLVVTLLVLGAVLLTAPRTPSGSADIPPNLPPEIAQNLRDLHEAVDG